MQTVQVNAQDNEFIAAEIEAGHFATAEQTVGAALQLLRQHQVSTLEHLREIACDAFAALDRGEGMEVKDIGAFVKDAVVDVRSKRAASAA